MEVKWIEITEDLPYDLEDVLVTTLNGKVDIGYRCEDVWYLNSYRGTWTDSKNVIAWMHLPRAYQKNREINNENNE